MVCFVNDECILLFLFVGICSLARKIVYVVDIILDKRNVNSASNMFLQNICISDLEMLDLIWMHIF